MECWTMQWNWGWRFIRDGLSTWSKAGRSVERREPLSLEDWEARLIEEGVPEESATQLAAQLLPAYGRFGRGSAAALIQGASLSVALQAEERASVERSMRDVREVERLLGAFSGELEKLDEVLEVLSAYAQRMRSKPVKTSDRTLH